MTTEPIRLLLVDDHPVVRDGLRGMFTPHPDFTVLAEAPNGDEAVELANRLRPDVVLMDLRMPGGSGLAAIAEITSRGLPCRVLVLTTYDSDTDILPALEAGATGYLLKDAPRDQLFEAVRATAHDRTVLSPAVAARLAARIRTQADPAATDRPLSPREHEVLALVAKGNTNRDIARHFSSARLRSKPTSPTSTPNSA